MREEVPDTISSPNRTFLAVSKIYFNRKKSYVIIGGLGGVGLELTDWMVTKGATKFVLNSRSGVTNGYQSLCLNRWQKVGVTVEVNTENSVDIKGAKRLILAARKLGPVGGKFMTFWICLSSLKSFCGDLETYCQ